MKIAGAGPLALFLLLAGCASSYELIGTARPPIAPGQVQLYLEPPKREYQQIAIIRTSSKHSLSFTSQGKAEVGEAVGSRRRTRRQRRAAQANYR